MSPELEELEGDTWRAADSVEQAAAIVSLRVVDLPHHIPGSVERHCALCDAAVAVTPRTIVAFKGKPWPPIWCQPCALTVVRRGGRA